MMANIRSINEIILSLIDFFRIAQPDLDTKPGTVARDLFIESPAVQLSELYAELSSISNKQSLRMTVGSELDNLAKNFSITRRGSTFAGGVALLTFSSIPAPLSIPSGSLIFSSNGFTYSTVSGISINTSSINTYRSVATKYRDQLDTLGISDEYAVEITVLASTSGSAGNIGKYSLNKTNIAGVSNVTNISAFTGGVDSENDLTFRNRVLSSFSGSSVGTALGYLNVAMSTAGVADAVVVEPGSPLMVRDGTDVVVNADGSSTIVSEGSGGKVDIVVMGSTLIENVESYIYKDKSNVNDPTNSKNNIVLGQISADVNKTINRKRIDNLKSGQLPIQPVESLLQVSGSLSGSNFVEKSVDSLGRVVGNYELIKDTGAYSGSPWGFDTFHWISNKISLFSEDRVKGQINGQDVLTYSEVDNISNIQQLIPISNENSTVTADRSVIQLLHYPVTNVTRVFNVNTGERYIVSSQNPDKTGTYNTTGRIKISGNTLPSPSNTLQVDYSWVVNYDNTSDFDGLKNTINLRNSVDTVDWGYSSLVREELIPFTKDPTTNYFTGKAAHNISSVITAKTFSEITSVVSTGTGIYGGRLVVAIRNLMETTLSVDSIKLKNNRAELYNTAQADGLFFNANSVVGIETVCNTTIVLPLDSSAKLGEVVSVYLNSQDVFSATDTNGSFSTNQITIPSSMISTTATSIVLSVSYIAAIADLFSSTTTSLPTSRLANGFRLSNNNGSVNLSQANIITREYQSVQLDIYSQLVLGLSINSSEYTLTASDIVSVIRRSDNSELWNSDHPGTVYVDDNGKYQLVLFGTYTPAVNDQCLIVYKVIDTNRYQPFSYSNDIIKTRIDQLVNEPISGQMAINLNKFYTQASGLTFTITEPNNNITLFTVADGYLTSGSGDATVGSLTQNFNIPDLLYKRITIRNATNSKNNGTFDIISYNQTSNTFTIKNIYDNITADQICVVRISDGKEIWSSSGTIQVDSNRILLPINSTLNSGDNVFLYTFNINNLRSSPTKIVATTTDQTINTGVISINGTTVSKAVDIIFTASNTGLKQNLSEALKKALGLATNSVVPSNVKLAKIVKLEKVITSSANSEEVVSVQATYDTINSTIQSNLLYMHEMLQDPSFQSADFKLPATINNTENLEHKNLPTYGDKLRVSFYYTTSNDSENMLYTSNGILYTNKKFAIINKILVASGFKTSQSTKFTATSFLQPSVGSRYKAFYDYLAPKQNERIILRYNYNKLISDITFSVEATRPVNADVLVKSAKLLLLDLTMNVVIANDYKSSQSTVLQNLRDKLTSSLTATQLGATIDEVTLINVAQAVPGIARARILYFNKTGKPGQVLIINAQDNEYFAPNDIIINTETR